MKYLLDTNVVSEWVKPQPNSGVLAWLSECDEDAVYLSVVTIAELRHGIERLPADSRRRRLDNWLNEDLRARFEGRILPIDEAVADAWGRIVAERDRAGRPIAVIDAFLAATARVRSLAVVTNDADLASSVDVVVNPWA